MRGEYQRRPSNAQWTLGAPTNTGDGIRAALRVDAAISYMDDAWWAPSIPLPKGPWFALAERSLPRSLMVNASGQRFMNESLPYVEAAHRSEEHTSELQSLMRLSYAVFCLQKKNHIISTAKQTTIIKSCQ